MAKECLYQCRLSQPILLCTKEKFAIFLMAIADADRRIHWFDMSCAPPTHDTLAWLMAKLGQRFEHGEVPDGFFLFCDSTLSMVTPGNDMFNFGQCSLRINAECALAELISRWGIYGGS